MGSTLTRVTPYFSAAVAGWPDSVGEFQPARGLEGPFLRIHAHVARDEVADGDELLALRTDLDAVPDAGVRAREPERARAQLVGLLAKPRDAAAAADVPRLFA